MVRLSADDYLYLSTHLGFAVQVCHQISCFRLKHRDRTMELQDLLLPTSLVMMEICFEALKECWSTPTHQGQYSAMIQLATVIAVLSLMVSLNAFVLIFIVRWRGLRRIQFHLRAATFMLTVALSLMLATFVGLVIYRWSFIFPLQSRRSLITACITTVLGVIPFILTIAFLFLRHIDHGVGICHG
ncbi:hypothetical protein GOP47_0021860 [Adiantum capillus-veneris]|uniref:Uncharacterized protein n=1 Tax=Adiantum capillus-veneris TaxID=13818 RepID=A0A9D4U8B1_ADICA|nr:hypothetical protein GOP47_0021860 [Adiantum capillus-veneris]